MIYTISVINNALKKNDIYKMEKPMITLKIENPEIEIKLMDFVKNQNQKLEDVTIEAIKQFISSFEDDKLIYQKKDVKQHIHTLKVEYDDKNLENVKPYSHVSDSAKYIKDLRSKRSYE